MFHKNVFWCVNCYDHSVARTARRFHSCEGMVMNLASVAGWCPCQGNHSTVGVKKAEKSFYTKEACSYRIWNGIAIFPDKRGFDREMCRKRNQEYCPECEPYAKDFPSHRPQHPHYERYGSDDLSWSTGIGNGRKCVCTGPH